MTSLDVAKEKRVNADRCDRCGGLMVSEEVFQLGSFDWRCVSCGERIDPVILAHRQVHRPKTFSHETAKHVIAGRDKLA